MNITNKINNLRKSLGAEIISLYFADKLEIEIDKTPIKRAPKNRSSLRCCTYKDRAMYRYRLLSLMGIDIEKEDDEYRSISSFAKEALQRNQIDHKILTVIDIACASCQQNTYMVTDMCKGCVARPCEENCPKDAIQIINNKSIINQDLCISCGKCEKVCPYNAIIYSPVPCEDKCPVNAISRNPETGKEEIDYDKCIYCGRCTRACPFGTIMERSQILDISKQLKHKKNPVIAMIAPSIIGQFPGTIGQIIYGLKELGFDYVYEVAVGADITAQKEAEEFIEKQKEGQPILGTSCCPAYVESVKKHVKTFEKYISHTKTPMAYTAELAKKEHPESTTLFIGPCIAKKYEGTNDQNVDYVLTFEELSSFFLALKIDLLKLEEAKYDTIDATIEAQRFCINGGVAAAVKYYLNKTTPDIEINPYYINGLDKKGLKQLEIAANGKLPNNLVECMSCEGGCLSGPGVIVSPAVSARKLVKPT